MSDFPASGRLAGIDYGTVRIGVAVCDPSRMLASPYENYTRRDMTRDAEYFRELVRSERIVGFVVGLPVHTSGQESQKSREARQFAAWLTEITSLPTCFYDERFTSREAEGLLGDARMTKKRKKQRLDMVAAQLLLAAFLESDQQGMSPAALDDSST
jgi:putative holliday junction resolvase